MCDDREQVEIELVAGSEVMRLSEAPSESNDDASSSAASVERSPPRDFVREPGTVGDLGSFVR